MVRHQRAVAAYVAGQRILRLAGVEAERAVRSVCELDQAPCSLAELEALRQGLQALTNAKGNA